MAAAPARRPATSLMEHALSTHLFVNQRLTAALLDRVLRAGIPAVEIFCARQHLDYRDRAQVREIANWFRDSELKLHSLHAPMYSDEIWGRTGPHTRITITEPVKTKRIQMVDEIKRAIEIAEAMPYRYLIQHLGVQGEEFDQRKLDAAFTSLEELSLFAKHRGVEVLLENIPNELSSAGKLLMFLDMTHLDLNICFDVGHAHLMASIGSEYEALQPRIRSTHVHDNNGKDDQHLFPGAAGGSVDWRSTMKLLGSRENQYPLLLELREASDLEHPLEEANRIFDHLESLKQENES
jgi:sugar phosphate isomerase/epimerase